MLNVPVSIEDIEYLERRTEKVIKRIGIENLMDYTPASVSGCDLDDLYKTIVQQVLIEEVYVSSFEISNGKYEIVI